MIVRHGKSTWNDNKLLKKANNKPNVPLHPDGVDDAESFRDALEQALTLDFKQAPELAQQLQTSFQRSRGVVMASNLRRAIDTCSIGTAGVLLQYGLSPYIMSNLQETSGGTDAQCDRRHGVQPMRHHHDSPFPTFDMTFFKFIVYSLFSTVQL